jgi:FKBP-type peptidyl-prolyl cis-trans isomerase SlyD
MEPSEGKVVRLSPAQAYGELDEELVMEVPLTEFAPEVELKPGLVFETENEEGQPVYFIVQEVHSDHVVIDFNHPLAGKELEVSFTVRQVREATKEDLEQHQGGACPHCGEGEPHQH